jgi:hypothetical protein
VNTDDDDEGGSVAGVDSKSYDAPWSYSIRIKNNSNHDLLAFKSQFSSDTVLGMVPKRADDHGLKLNTALFPPGQSQDFSVVFLTREDYELYKNNLSSREQYAFTRLFAVYIDGGDNKTPVVVSAMLGGGNMLVINNKASWNMELREDSPQGVSLICVPSMVDNTPLYVNQGGFYVFPVFKWYSLPLDEIITVYPRDADGNPVKENLSFEDGNAPPTINAGTYTTNTVMSSGQQFSF